MRRSSYRKNLANKGNVKVTSRHAVWIDLDNDTPVIIDDTAESPPPKFQTSNVRRERRNSSDEGVINIDDDEDSSVDLASDASSSKRQFPARKTTRNPVNLGTKKCEDWGKTSFQFSKCKQTYCTTSGGRNRYGLDPVTDSSDTDCEIVEDSLGNLREQWEKASRRRKQGVPNCHSGYEDRVSRSESNNAARAKENGSDQRSEIPVCSSSGNTDRCNEIPPECVASDDDDLETFPKSRAKSPFVSADQNVEQEKPAPDRNDERNPQTSFKHEGETTSEDKYCCNECKAYPDVCDGIPSFCKEKKHSPRSPFMSFEEVVGDEQSTQPRSSPKENENRDPKASLFKEMETGFEGDEVMIFRTVVEAHSVSTSGKACYQDNVEADYHPDTKQNKTFSVRGEGVKGNDDLSGTKSCIINERENLKDTEEYKRATEEEWASRQRELRIQAEEAQRLRRRKKAESMRLFDIERRQKQRLEEVRETQKKDAENTNLKEHFRAEILKDIKRLETTCTDMASLLRGLGIQVNGGFNPTSPDINAAYKRALLKFHPDRASKTDIRQMVEAEEKFKLISRMKEKLLL